jgi:hypothetical protein
VGNLLLKGSVMAGVYGEINSRVDYRRVLNEVTLFMRTLGRNSHGTTHPMQRIQKELGAMKRWTENGRVPTDAERHSIDVGLIAVREFDGATGKLGEFAQKLSALNNYFEDWPTDHAAASATDDDFWNDDSDDLSTKYPGRADSFFEAEGSVASEVKKHEVHNLWNLVRKNMRVAASMPFLIAFAVFWLVKKIAPNSDFLLGSAFSFLVITIVWMVALMVYSFYTFVLFVFARCPKCHRFYVWRSKCGSCGVRRSW